MTTTKTLSKTATPSKAKASPKDAIALLKADHDAVSQLFAEYEKTRSVNKKKALVAEICDALTVHAQIEEEIFASLEESVGEFWLWKPAKHVIQGKFCYSEGPVAVGFSQCDFALVVQPLDHAA